MTALLTLAGTALYVLRFPLTLAAAAAAAPVVAVAVPAVSIGECIGAYIADRVEKIRAWF